MEKQIAVYKDLYETYRSMGLLVDSISQGEHFTIHNLKELHPELPFASKGYRPNYFSFVFVKDAVGKYTIDDQSFDTMPGTIYFTNPGHYKSFEWKSIEELYLITFTDSFLKENVHRDIFSEFPFLLSETVYPRTLPPEAFREFEQLYLQIYKEYHSGSSYKDKIIGNFFVILLLKIKEYFWADYNPIYEGNRNSQIVKTFKRNLEKHYQDLLHNKADTVFRPQDYGRLQSLHPNYLNNVIKTKTGKSITTWITEKTIGEAKTLLQNSSIAIKEIAFSLGFTEATHFSNYFKKYTESSPAEYRKQHLQGQG